MLGCPHCGALGTYDCAPDCPRRIEPPPECFIVWSSAEAKEAFDMMVEEMTLAFSIPRPLLNAGEAAIRARLERAAQETEKLRKMLIDHYGEHITIMLKAEAEAAHAALGLPIEKL